MVNVQEVAEGAASRAHLDAERVARDAEDCGAAQEELKRAILVPKNENYSLKWFPWRSKRRSVFRIMLSTMLGLGSEQATNSPVRGCSEFAS